MLGAVAAGVLLPSLSGASGQEEMPGMALIPAGSFEMGDHHGFVDPKHGGDETPIHVVRLDPFYIGINDITTKEYCEFLNPGWAQKQIEVRDDGVYLVGGADLLCETRAMSPYSRMDWEGNLVWGFDHATRDYQLHHDIKPLPNYRKTHCRRTSRSCSSPPLSRRRKPKGARPGSADWTTWPSLWTWPS